METNGSKMMTYIDLNQDGNFFMPVEPVRAGFAENLSRRRAWMVYDHFKCPVVGTPSKIG